MVKICIKDNGDGFSKDSLENDTNLFFMDDKSRNSKQNFGIGLSLAKAIVELYKGILCISNDSDNIVNLILNNSNNIS